MQRLMCCAFRFLICGSNGNDEKDDGRNFCGLTIYTLNTETFI